MIIMRKYTFGILVLVFVIFLAAFNNYPADKQQLINTEHDFSKMCVEKGQKAAFLYYMDDQAVLVHSNSYPLKGNVAREFYDKSMMGPDVLSW